MGGPRAAGLALVSRETGRVLMLQRALIDGEPNGGLWEFPGGKLDEGEDPLDGARREFSEEVGHEPPAGDPSATWLSANGVYQGFVVVCDGEGDCPINTDHAERPVQDPDNPGGSNYTEAMAWFDPVHLESGPDILRPEVKATPWHLVTAAETPGLVATVAMLEDYGIVWDGAPLVAAAEKPPNSVKLSTGWAFPIPDKEYLRKAIQAFGRAKPGDRAKVKAHIISRARALGLTQLIPEGWMTAAVDPYESLLAALAAPASAFTPEEPLPGPTPFSVRADGTVDGHLALWASCHIGYPGCVKPPREDSFDFYNLGEAVTADGRSVPVGKVTVGTGHAGPDLSWRTAAAHYDESGTAVAVVHAVADKWGIRLPGALVADVEGGRVDELRRSPLSGDWRRVNGRLRLVASLGVNVPGYPIPRALVAAGEVQSMFVGFDPSDAAAVVLEADDLAASLGLDAASRARALRAAALGS